MSSRISQRLLWGVLSLSLVLIAGFAIAKWTHENARHLEDFGALPNFSLVDEHGASASLQNFNGHIWIADMIFTHCPSLCPTLTAKMILLQSALQDKSDVRFASISVDPLHDLPDTLLARMQKPITRIPIAGRFSREPHHPFIP